MSTQPQQHHHPAMQHDEEHLHVTHYQRPGEDWTHLESTHAHEHNHPELDHAHPPHENVEQEHRREAHIHDHARPAQSPG